MLLKEQHYIDGKWKGAPTIPVTNPANGDIIGHIADGGAQEAELAIQAAARALPAWRDKTAKERSTILRRWYTLIMAHQETLAELLTREQGKPISEARGEIAYGAAYIEWYAEEARRVYGQTIPAAAPNQSILVQKQPVGVCAAITPWNFPNAMITRKAAPALAAGCTFIIRPASQTPFSALALAVLAEEAGIPPGVFNVVTGDAQSIGKTLTESDIVRKFSFTGSTETGRLLMRQCASTIKKISLELGGNAPFIVFDDADLDAAVQGAIASKFRNAGQTCVCANRFYVQSTIYDAFVKQFAAAAARLTVGNGLDANTHIGPLIDSHARDKVHAFLHDAQSKGAHILGGGTDPAGDLFMRPAVIRDATTDMRFAREEIFGPLAPVFRFEREEEAVEHANATEYGLAAYFYAHDIGRIHRVMNALEYGMIGINSGVISNEAAPFGGVKQSGLGREGGRQGIEEYLETKYCLIAY